MSEWQPIETAPQDGTQILVFGHDTFAVAEFRNGEWRDMGDIGWGGFYAEVMPTHWMPLPEPPSNLSNK